MQKDKSNEKTRISYVRKTVSDPIPRMQLFAHGFEEVQHYLPLSFERTITVPYFIFAQPLIYLPAFRGAAGTKEGKPRRTAW